MSSLAAPSSGQVILIRHGQTEWNANRRFQGQLDIPLNDVGREQAAAVASRLGGLTVNALIASDSGRAASTAAAVGAVLDVPVETDPGLREIFLGTWQGLNTQEAEAQFPSEYAEWRAGVDVRRGGGETYLEVAQRAAAALSRYSAAYDHGTVVVVTHGGTARALAGLMTGLPHELWSLLGPLANCRLTVLGAAGARGWRLRQHNSTELAEEGPSVNTVATDR